MKQLRKFKNIVTNVIDWFYKPFKRFIPIETFRYGVCGGTNTLFDIVLYFLTYNFVLDKQNIDFGIVTISPYIMAFIIVFPITFTSGFLLSKYITFTQSEVKGKVQFLRYGLTVMGSILLNYVFLKFFVEVCGFYATMSKILTTFIVVIYSYFAQKHYTFKASFQFDESDHILNPTRVLKLFKIAK